MFIKTRLLALIALAAFTACETSKTDESKKEKKHDTTTAEASGKTKHASMEGNVDGVDINKVSEALGHFIGRNLKTAGIDFDVESIIKGLREGAAGKPAPMDDADYEKAMGELQQKAYNATAEKNLDAANKFMTENKNQKDVIELIPGSLQYTVLENGNGPVVPEHGTPLINYTGKYIDGTVFGSSENAGGPITVPIDQTIPGFSKGIAGMKEGEKRRLFVHPEAGYGKTGQLLPNSLLIFDIEVVKATSPEKDAAMSNGGSPDDADFDDDFDSIDFDEQVIESPAAKPAEKAPVNPTEKK